MVLPKKNQPSSSTNGTHKKEQSEARTMGGNTGRSDHKANGNSGGFRTDTAISSGRLGTERKLQRWVPDDSDTFGNMTLDSSTEDRGWDQFRENERRFGLKSDYDENIYTTTLPSKNSANYKERAAAADKKAAEIMGSAAATAHVAEERIMDFVGGNGNEKDDEEDKYSGVKRQDFPPLPGGQNNKYTPPARRAPTGASTVKGAPVDPAIISSQLKAPAKTSPAPKAEEAKNKVPKTEAPSAPSPAKAAETKTDSKEEPQPKPADTKPSTQTPAPLKPSAATGRTISPQGKEAAPSATSTVERDVLKEFKTFANQQRLNAEKARSTKAKADKEIKLTELKKFADSFKLPTLVPVDLIPIIAKDPAKQREIQEKAQRDVDLMAKRKADENVSKEKKASISKETPTAASGAAPEPANNAANAANNASKPARAAPAPNSTQAAAGPQQRHANNRNSYAPGFGGPYQGNRQGPPHMQGGRQQGNLSTRIRNIEQQKQSMMQGDPRMPPTGPANTGVPAFNRSMPSMANQLGGKLNPNSHEFRPSPFAASFSPNGHPSAASSPRSGQNNATDTQSGTAPAASLVVVTKKRKAVDPKKCVILSHVKSISPPDNKNWNENDGLRPSYDTLPTWRTLADNEKPDSTMHMTYNEYLEKQPFAAQPTPNTAHAMPQMAHQHQLPFHLQHGAHSFGPRHSPHVPPVQMHGGHHGPVPHAQFNGNDDHRMMHSNSTQSYSSPRMGQVPMAHPPNMNSPGQMPYNQPGMPQFMGAGQGPMGPYNRSYSNNGQFMPQPGAMGGPMMIPGQYMNPQGMVAPPQMPMYPSGNPQFIPPGSGPPQQMPGANGYPSPGRPSAPMMAHQGSQQGQQVYGMSPGMHYQQPAFAPQQQGPMNPSRGYNNQGPQHFGTSPSQMHQYGPQRGSNNSFKSYPAHNSPGTQSGQPTPPTQSRPSDTPAETK